MFWYLLEKIDVGYSFGLLMYDILSPVLYSSKVNTTQLKAKSLKNITVSFWNAQLTFRMARNLDHI